MGKGKKGKRPEAADGRLARASRAAEPPRSRYDSPAGRCPSRVPVRSPERAGSSSLAVKIRLMRVGKKKQPTLPRRRRRRALPARRPVHRDPRPVRARARSRRVVDDRRRPRAALAAQGRAADRAGRQAARDRRRVGAVRGRRAARTPSPKPKAKAPKAKAVEAARRSRAARRRRSAGRRGRGRGRSAAAEAPAPRRPRRRRSAAPRSAAAEDAAAE